MRPGLMNKQEVIKKAERVWLQHPSWARDDRKRWALGLGRIRKLLMAERDKQDREEEDTLTLQQKLQQLRLEIQEGGSEHRREERQQGQRLNRREVLQLMDKRMTVDQNRTLRGMPDASLIEYTVRNLPKEKSRDWTV
ncbi:hypothetical protein R1sor_026944 [Riccia sorocarpa]|uniref:Uncharacterized protein n=1 Tax=Riccia sorocarpa TaxID=122646 RepID=A0ABD3GEJ0_9MARC